MHNAPQTNPEPGKKLRIAARVLGQGHVRLAEVMLRDALASGASGAGPELLLGQTLLSRTAWWEGASRLCRGLSLLDEKERSKSTKQLRVWLDSLAAAAEKRGLNADVGDYRSLGKALLTSGGDPMALAARWLPQMVPVNQTAALQELADWLRDDAAPHPPTPEQVDALLQVAAANPGYKQLFPLLVEALAPQVARMERKPAEWARSLVSVMTLAGESRQTGLLMAAALIDALGKGWHPDAQKQFIFMLSRFLLLGDSPYHKEATEAYREFCWALHPDEPPESPSDRVHRLFTLYAVEEADRTWAQARRTLVEQGDPVVPGASPFASDSAMFLHQYRTLGLAEKQEIEQALAAPYCDRVEREAKRLGLEPVHGVGSRNDGGPLRIGYLTRSAYRHSMGHVLLGTLHNHGDAVQATVYDSDNQYRRDPVAEGIRRAAAAYHRIELSGPEQTLEAARRIAADGIDVLVDLECCFGRAYALLHYLRPAPVSCAYAGGDSVGIRFIDYYLADRWCLPPQADDYYMERPFRLPRFTYVLEGYERHGEETCAAVRERLSISIDAMVYLIAAPGSKITGELAEDVMEVLHRVPGSVLLIKGRGNQEWMREFWYGRARAHGVDPVRLKFLAFAPTTEQHRMELGAADLVLDTFPYNGASHSFEALWCGTPVVTRYGETFMSRMSYSMLKNLELPEGIAADRTEYVERAVALGLDRAQRGRLRRRLLEAAESRSSIWDARGIADDLEQALLGMSQAGRPEAAR